MVKMKKNLEFLLKTQKAALNKLENYDKNPDSFIPAKSEDSSEIFFLDAEAIRELNVSISKMGIRDNNLLESAVARPKQSCAYANGKPSMTNMAFLLAEGIIQNHPFVDGNKRTAFLAMNMFLLLNDFPIAKDSERVADLLLYLTVKTITIDQAISEFDHMKKEFPGNEKKHSCDESDNDEDFPLTQGM